MAAVTNDIDVDSDELVNSAVVLVVDDCADAVSVLLHVANAREDDMAVEVERMNDE